MVAKSVVTLGPSVLKDETAALDLAVLILRATTFGKRDESFRWQDDRLDSQSEFVADLYGFPFRHFDSGDFDSQRRLAVLVELDDRSRAHVDNAGDFGFSRSQADAYRHFDS